MCGIQRQTHSANDVCCSLIKTSGCHCVWKSLEQGPVEKRQWKVGTVGLANDRSRDRPSVSGIGAMTSNRCLWRGNLGFLDSDTETGLQQAAPPSRSVQPTGTEIPGFANEQ